VSSQPVGPTYYADFAGLEGLKRDVKADDSHSIRAVAQQFESLFTNMMLKAMREAKLSQGLGDSQQSDLYEDMYDQQIALKLSQGKGLGLADMLVQQLTRNRAAKAADTLPASGSGSAPPAPPANRIGFIRMIEPYAERAAGQLGVSSDTLIAQAALETGWGQHVPAASGDTSSFNLFGVKAGGSWNGDAVTSLTSEYDAAGGPARSVSQPFRAYASVQQGVNDYVTLLQRHSRYSQALGTGDDVGAFGGALARGGYATDPDYVQKLQATVASVKALRATDTATLKNPAAPPTTAPGEIS